MTLSFWFRDCIYMRSLLLHARKKLLKSQFAMSNVAFLINFFIMGIWHGIEVLLHCLWFIPCSIVYRLWLLEHWRKKHPPR